jgi:hypothetical protein
MPTPPRLRVASINAHGGSGFAPWGCVVVGGGCAYQKRLGLRYSKSTAKTIHDSQMLSGSPIQTGFRSRPGGVALAIQHANEPQSARTKEVRCYRSPHKHPVFLMIIKESIELTEDSGRSSGKALMGTRREHVEGRGTSYWATSASFFFFAKQAGCWVTTSSK